MSKCKVQYTIVVADEPEKTDFSTLGDIDVMLDYVYGPLVVHLFNSLPSHRPIQYVHIRGLGRLDVDLPRAILRSKNLTIRRSRPRA